MCVTRKMQNIFCPFFKKKGKKPASHLQTHPLTCTHTGIHTYTEIPAIFGIVMVPTFASV